MECVCNQYMQMIETESEYYWEDDIPTSTTFEVYECQNCGMVAKIDVSNELCENPY